MADQSNEMVGRRKERYADAAQLRARRMVRYELEVGRMKNPGVCSVCSKPDTKARDGRSIIQAHHHAGYDRPLDVVWLCAVCHTGAEGRSAGHANGRPPLSDAEIAAIRAQHNPRAHWKKPEGSFRQMARDYRVSPRTIKRIVRGETRRDAALSHDEVKG